MHASEMAETCKLYFNYSLLLKPILKMPYLAPFLALLNKWCASLNHRSVLLS